MFGNLTLESEERRTNAPAVKVEASPEVTALIKSAWAKQQDNGEKALGHIVGPIGDKETVERFHAEARAACNAHEPRLKYRKLARVGKSKEEDKAYFAVSLWPVDETDDENAPTPDGNGTAEAAPEKPATRRRTAK